MAPYQFRPPNGHNGAHLKSKILLEGSATLVGGGHPIQITRSHSEEKPKEDPCKNKIIRGSTRN